MELVTLFFSQNNKRMDPHQHQQTLTSLAQACTIGAFSAFLIALCSLGGITSWGAMVAGFFTLVVGLLFLLFKIFLPMTTTTNISFLQVVNQSAPFLLLLGVIGFTLYQYIVYKNIIVEQQVSSSFNLFQNLFVLLVLLQLYVTMYSPSPSPSPSHSPSSSIILYLFALAEFICSVLMYFLLRYFHTDG